MPKKPRYFAEISRKGILVGRIEIFYRRRDSVTWEAFVGDHVMMSCHGRKVSFRDNMMEAVVQNLENYWVEQVVEKCSQKGLFPKTTSHLEKCTNDEKWFVTSPKPDWFFPIGSNSSVGHPLAVYRVLKNFLEKPEILRVLKNLKTSEKFNI